MGNCSELRIRARVMFCLAFEIQFENGGYKNLFPITVGNQGPHKFYMLRHVAPLHLLLLTFSRGEIGRNPLKWG